MGYAVELYFDAGAESTLRRLIADLAAAGVPDILGQLGARPHVSLAVFAAVDPEALIEQTAAFAGVTAPFDLTLSHIGTFPTTEGIVFAGPTPTAHLLSLHRAYHERLASAGITPDNYYVPERWVPHCTTATDLTPAQVAMAVCFCVEAFRPVQVTCQEIGVISYRPVRIAGRCSRSRARDGSRLWTDR